VPGTSSGSTSRVSSEAKACHFEDRDVPSLEQLENARGEATAEIYIPMHRSDVADYVGMSLPAVSRTFATLAKRGVITIRDRRHVTIADRAAFESIVASGIEAAATEAGLHTLVSRK
jgi:hypothetical protein